MKQALNLKILAELLVMVGWVAQLRFEEVFPKTVNDNLILEENSGDSDHFLFLQRSAKEYKQTLREENKNV